MPRLQRKRGGTMTMMKTGMSRSVDELGRVVLPKEIRDSLNLKPGVRVDILVDGDCIILKRNDAFCACCGRNSHHMLSHGGVSICEDCYRRFAPAGGELHG